MAMRELTFRDALQEALIEEFARFPDLFIMGEDIVAQGGVFGVHRTIATDHPHRLVQTPISEPGFIGMAVGAAMTGGPIVCEIMFQDFMTVCMDEIVNQAAKLRYMSGGQARMPLVIRSPCGMGRGSAAQHTQALESWFVHVPGLLVATPSTPADAKGLLKTAIRGADPVMFFEYKMLYALKGEVPDDDDFTIPFGSAPHRARGPAHHLRRHRVYGAQGDRGRGAAGRRGHLARDRRSAHALAARHRHDLLLGREDQPRADRRRGDSALRDGRRHRRDDLRASLRLSRRTREAHQLAARAEAVLAGAREACRADDRRHRRDGAAHDGAPRP
jgi:hypothetical protein